MLIGPKANIPLLYGWLQKSSARKSAFAKAAVIAKLKVGTVRLTKIGPV
jgi:hypothetical protein